MGDNNYIFFLGGYDAEMMEIKNILEAKELKFFDRQLSWGAASLSAYNDEIDKVSLDTIPVFIELKLDCPCSERSIIIDHHDEKAGNDKKTSIEQVADLLGIELNRHQQLISANDRGHIKAMRELCASDKEIAEIRLLDRKAQGVTDDDERFAEELIACRFEKISDDAVIVNSLTNKTSPVFDRLYDKYRHIFVFTPDGEMNYSGAGEVVNRLVDEYKKRQEKDPSIEFWFGGNLPDNGFFGTKTPLTNEEIKEMVKNDSKKIISQHIFMFPFRMEEKEKPSGSIETEGWIWKPFDFKFGDSDAPAKYSEYAYFHDYVRRALFSDGTDDISCYYEREIPKDAKLVIHIKDKKNYSLSLHHISLRLFDTKVGIFTIEVLNYDAPAINDILHINEFGRRIYPQFIGEGNDIKATKGAFLADKIELFFGTDKPITEDFNCNEFLSKELKFAKYIEWLLGDSFCSIYKITPIIDDRMFTICWYGDDGLSRCLKRTRGDGYEYESSAVWYSIVYIDGSTDSGIDNKNMQKELIKQATYPRWVEAGTLYGISRYSLICVTDTEDYGYNHIRNHMQRMYYQMAVILLAQRASILKFSDDVSRISGEIETFVKAKNYDKTKFEDIAEKVKGLHASFIRFVNRLWFTEVTPQEQGIEMYNMAVKNMGIEGQLIELRAEIKELYEFVEMQYEKETNKSLALLDKIAFILLPIIVVASLLGMNILSPDDIPYGWYGRIGLLTGLLIFAYVVTSILKRIFTNKRY
jgi:hypothetical protein